MNDDFMNKQQLLDHLEFESQVFRNPLIKDAFYAIDRKDFVGADYEIEAYEDYAIPIGHGEYISQPTTLAFILELLKVAPGDIVLDVGAGTGYLAALLGHMVGDAGQVYSLDIHNDFVQSATRNIKKYPKLPVEVRAASDDAGYYAKSPYNRIVVSAALPEKDHTIIFELLLQLAPGGIMIVPVGESLMTFEKVNDDEYYETEYPGFTFGEYIIQK
jgi:protein-L-isoaspartate(D-aspartate) O-methyltransferase